MEEEVLYITCFQCFTKEEVEKYFSNYVSETNLDILKAHICHSELSKDIEGFTEQNGILFLLIKGEMVSVNHNPSHPTFIKYIEGRNSICF
jgi:predicted nucleic acid-binding protein